MTHLIKSLKEVKAKLPVPSLMFAMTIVSSKMSDTDPSDLFHCPPLATTTTCPPLATTTTCPP